MEISKTSWHFGVWKNWYDGRDKQLPEQISLCVYCRQLGWILFFTAAAAVARTAWKYFIVPTFTAVFALLGLIFNIGTRCMFVPLLLLMGSYPTRECLFNLKFDAFEDIEEYWLPSVKGYRITPLAVILSIGYLWATTATVLDFRANGWAVLSDKNFGHSATSIVVMMHMIALGIICVLGVFGLAERFEDRFQWNRLNRRREHHWLAETAALLGAYLNALKQRVCPIIVFVNGDD